MGKYLTAMLIPNWEYPSLPVSGYPLGASLDEAAEYLGIVPRTQIKYTGENETYSKYPDILEHIYKKLHTDGYTERGICYGLGRDAENLCELLSRARNATRNDSEKYLVEFVNAACAAVRKYSLLPGDPRWEETLKERKKEKDRLRCERRNSPEEKSKQAIKSKQIKKRQIEEEKIRYEKSIGDKRKSKKR